MMLKVQVHCERLQLLGQVMPTQVSSRGAYYALYLSKQT